MPELPCFVRAVPALASPPTSSCGLLRGLQIINRKARQGERTAGGAKRHFLARERLLADKISNTMF